MGFFNNLGKLVLDIVETPIAAVKDIATMGAQLTDEGKPYTQRKLEDIQEDFDGMKESLKDKKED